MSPAPDSLKSFMVRLFVLWLLLAAIPLAADTREHLKPQFMLGVAPMPSPVPSSAYERPPGATKPSNRLEGRLLIDYPSQTGKIEVIRDDQDLVNDEDLNLDQLPPLDAELVQRGEDIVPVVRGRQESEHPYWEWILEPGVAWDEPLDKEWSRAVLPFSLQERNANCTHNGLLSFLYRTDGRVSRLAFQVTSETCLYLKIDFWGAQAASLVQHEVEGASEVLSAYAQEIASRLPVKAISELATDYPGVDPEGFTPPDPEHATLWGLVTDGTHYRGDCETRYGPHPYCEVLDLPAYSTAKSSFAGLALMHLETLFADVSSERISAWVNECDFSGQWGDVSFQNALNMSTGNYDSPDYMTDEDNAFGSDFFTREKHSERLPIACDAYPKKQSAGARWVYHTSDTYVLGTALSEYVNRFLSIGADLYDDLMVDRLWKPLELSPVTWVSSRTYDSRGQPFTGYGMTYLPDDIARIGKFLNIDDGKIGNRLMFDAAMFERAMHRGNHVPVIPLESFSLNYQNGFWSANGKAWINCSQDTWIPFMSGFGGITVAMMPNDTVYYVFSDDGEFSWEAAARESNKLRSYCVN